jgi:hypothetical protein
MSFPVRGMAVLVMVVILVMFYEESKESAERRFASFVVFN